MYVNGMPASNIPALGIKALCAYLNRNGFKTKKGGMFGVGPLQHLLQNEIYVGRGHYNIRSGRTRAKKPPEDVVEFASPAIVDPDIFARATQKRISNHPSMTPPRLVTSQIILTGLAICESCGGGMTQRTGTSHTGKVYSYYACAANAQKGSCACKKPLTIRMEVLDGMVLKALRERLFTEEVISSLLASLMERRAALAAAVSDRISALQKEVALAEEALKRLYHFIALGQVGADDILKDKVSGLQNDRDRAKRALERALAQSGRPTEVEPGKVQLFLSLVSQALSGDNVRTVRAYLRSIITRVVVGEHAIKIIGNKEVLAHAVTDGVVCPPVRSFEPKWRTRQDSNL